jgi:hypothetical protein
MFLGSRPARAICSVIITAALAIGALGDTIHLKDGSILKGRIVRFADGRFTIVIGDGSRRRELTFDVDEVESIQFDSPQIGSDSVPSKSRDTASNSSRDTGSTTSRDTDIYTPVTIPQRQSGGASTSKPAPTRTGSSGMKPIELKVKVLSDNTSNGWTNSGWVVKKGQRIHISGSGEVSIGGGKKVSPSGAYDIDDGQKLLKNVPTGALLAVIGDDNNDFIYVGSDREFTAERDGALFLGINEGNLNDNSGTFDVRIEIRPEGDE